MRHLILVQCMVLYDRATKTAKGLRKMKKKLTIIFKKASIGSTLRDYIFTIFPSGVAACHSC